MINKLHIKCPCCGAILEVTNSQYEAVKTVICPGCKKRLAVDFQEKPVQKPITPFYYGEMTIDLHEGLNQVPIPDCAHLEINVVCLSDGGSKCIVRPLSADHPVVINNTQMELEDKAVLTKGDLLRIGNTTLTYGKAEERKGASGINGIILGDDSADEKPQKSPRFYGWLISVASLVVAVFLVVLLWPKREMTPFVAENEIPVDSSAVEHSVPASSAEPLPSTHQGLPRQTERVITETEPPQLEEPSYSSMSDYELELQARNDVKAQYEYGKRLVNKNDSAHLVLGINYLKMAIRNGSNDARQALQSTYNNLEQKAANGNRVAENILKEQR